MADLVFAFDLALDRPIPIPAGAPLAALESLAAAPWAALQTAFSTAQQENAAAVVLCGRVLDPLRASPAQVASLRLLITNLAAEGCHTIWLTANASDCINAAAMLGNPSGLFFVTPAEPLTLLIRGRSVEIIAAQGIDTPAERSSVSPLTMPAAEQSPSLLPQRIVVGWDTAAWNLQRWDQVSADSAGQTGSYGDSAGPNPICFQPGSIGIWGSRRLPILPAGITHLPPLQARSAHEASAGACATLTLSDRGQLPTEALSAGPLPHRFSTGLGSQWREVATHHVAWQSLAIASPSGGVEELATGIWLALEGLLPKARANLLLVNCSVGCGTNVSQRVRVEEIAAETLARVWQLCAPLAGRVWCAEIHADPSESLLPLGHAQAGGKTGSTTAFSAALADIVNALEQQLPADNSAAGLLETNTAREAGWLALELIESL